MVMMAEAPMANSPRSQTPPSLHCACVMGRLVVALTRVNCGGKKSATCTAVAGAGPVLVTRMV